MTCVLALDIAMHRTGWALGGPDWPRPQWGTFETVNWGKGTEGKNLSNFRKFLDEKGTALTALVIEQVFVDNRNGGMNFQWNGTQAQLMLSGVALQWADDRGIAVNEINIDDWRMRFLGLNRKPKDFKSDSKYWKNLALRRAAERNWFCTHHDEAEALGILDYALFALDKGYRLKTNALHSRAQLDIDHKRGIHS